MILTRGIFMGIEDVVKELVSDDIVDQLEKVGFKDCITCGSTNQTRCEECKLTPELIPTHWIPRVERDDAMIKASHQAGLTSEHLLEVFVQQGVMGVYNLGMKDMYDYLEG